MKLKLLAHGYAVPLGLALLLSPGLLTWPSRANDLNQLNQLLSTKQCPSCDLSNAGLAYARLSGVNLRGANLSRANLSQADLSGADLSGADLSGASLVGANLSGANLSGANLLGTDLRQAYLVNAILELVNARTTNLRRAIGIPDNAARPEDFYLWGTEEFQKGNHQGAIDNFSRALSLNPRYAAAYLGRGVSRFQLGDPQGALQDTKQAEQLFQAQSNPDGIKSAQQISQAIQTSQQPAQAGGGGDFFSFLGSLASVVLPFFLPGFPSF